MQTAKEFFESQNLPDDLKPQTEEQAIKMLAIGWGVGIIGLNIILGVHRKLRFLPLKIRMWLLCGTETSKKTDDKLYRILAGL